jgi:hypothetical protein
MPNNDQNDSVTLPEGLRQQFAQVERRLLRVESCVAACCIAGGMILSFLALFISDRIWETPVALRVLIFLLGVAAAVAAAWSWAGHWVWHRRDWRALAKMVQQKYRRLGDRLLGIVELANEQRHLANFSPALYHAAIHQVAGEAQAYDFRQSVSSRAARKLSGTAGVLCALLLAIAATLPEASLNAFRRWIAPASNIERYTLVQLEGFPAQLVVPHGESFDISGTVHYRSFWKPSRVLGLLARQPKIKGAAQSGQIHLEVPGQVDRGFLQIRVGDALAQVDVLPTHRPSLEELSALIQLPTYLRYPDQTQAVQGSSLLAVEGSKVAFEGKVSRPLASARMQKEDDDAVALEVQGPRFASASSQPAGMTELTFSWRDKLGLSNAVPWRLSLQMQKDAPPTPELPDLPREYQMLASDVLRIRVVAQDDFGVRDYGLMWDAVSDKPLSESISTEIKAQASNSRQKKVERAFLWSPEIFRIPADSTVELQAFARDFLPDRERAKTAPCHIRVLSPEEHAELVREELEATMAQAEEVTRLQEKIVANVRGVKEDEHLPEAQKSGRLGQSKEDQLQNSRQLDQLTKQAESAVQEAMKNPIFSEDVVRKWTQTMQNWQQLSQKQMKEAAHSMQAAQQNSKSRAQDMADAVQKAQDILEALEKMEEKANEHLDQLQALTLAQRLRKIGRQEKDLGAELVKNAPDTIGLLPEQLPDKFRRLELAFAGQQGNAQVESQMLQGEISRFFERTQKTNYGQVSTEMKQVHASEELDRLGGMIQNNISVQASGGLSTWSGRFHQWADKLEPKVESAQGSQGSGNSGKQLDLTKQLIELLRLRGKEMDLRDKTSVLDSQKGDPAAYAQQTGSLSQEQGALAEDLDRIHRDTPLRDLEQPFQDSTAAMKQVQQLLQKPQTDKETDQAQVKTVELLSDVINLINEQAQRNSSQPQSASDSASAEEMAFLMQMMKNSAQGKPAGMQPNRAGARPGGTTDKQARPLGGNAEGKSAAERNVNKAGGVIQNTPTEFRDALDNYFHGIEQHKN